MSHLPNVIVADASGKSYEIHDFLKPLIEKLALAKPHWVFKAKRLHTVRGEHLTRELVVSFKVHQGDECLGIVSTTSIYRSNKHVQIFEVKNDRITKERSRGQDFETTKLQSAFNVITKKFYRKTHEETIEAVISAANNVTYAIQDDKFEHFMDVRKHLYSPLMLDFIEQNEELVMNFYKSKNAKPEEINSITELRERRNAYDVIHKFRADMHKHYVVVPYEGKYLVKYLDNVQMYDDTTLPEHLRRNVGMLKLVDGNSFIPDVGCKVNTEAFIVYGD